MLTTKDDLSTNNYHENDRKIPVKNNYTWMENIIINYRWVFVLFILLPLSFFYDIYYYARSWIIFKLNSAPQQHTKKVEKIQNQVIEWKEGDQEYAMCTGRPGWQTISFRQPAYKKTHFKVDINLVDILNIDNERQTVYCEPLVTMGQLTSVLIEMGWTIPVVPELDDLTVGGLVMGTGIETSSHHYGLFQHICVSFEVVLSDGSVVKCSKDENKDLFYSIPWSYGTLCFLTAVEIKIIPAKDFVKVEYQPCYSKESLISTFEREVLKQENNQFVEALVFNEMHGVVMTGNMVSEAETKKINQIGRWYKPWFFKHVENFLKTGKDIEYIPLRHYYHRHSRSIFWEIKDIIPFGNNVVFRYLLGGLVPPKVSLLKLTQGQTIKNLYEKNHFIQDMLVPLSSITKSLSMFHREVKIYPIWLCPFKLYNNPGLLRSLNNQQTMFVDIGVYGVPKVDDYDPVDTTRRVEQFVREVNGFQMLYADTYMSENEFKVMFDHELYYQMREKLNCDKAFPEIYQKICRKARI